MFTKEYLRRNFIIFVLLWPVISVVSDLYAPWGDGLSWDTFTTVLSGWTGCVIGFALLGGFSSSTPETASSQQETDWKRSIKRTASIGGAVLMASGIGATVFMPRDSVFGLWLWLLVWPALGTVGIVFYWRLVRKWKQDNHE